MPSPEDWVKAYLDVRVPTLELSGSSIVAGPTVPVPIIAYANANEHQHQDPRDRVNSGLQGWVRGAGRRAGLLVTGNHIQLLAAVPIQTTLGTIRRVFNGKGSPAEIRDVLRLASLWFAAQPAALRNLGDVDLRTFGQHYVGVDCNGFVGSYLHYNHPETQYGPQFYIPGVPSHAHNRTAVQGAWGDPHVVQSLDLIVSRGWGHVAIIGQIHSRTEREITCNVCQSRSTELGGVHCGVATIRRQHEQFTMQNETATGIYGLRNLGPAA